MWLVNKVSEGANNVGKFAGHVANEAGKGIQHGVREVGNAGNHAANYAANTANGLAGNFVGFNTISKNKNNHNDGRPDYECILELRITNGYGFEITDVIQLKMEEWALDFCNEVDAFPSELSYQDGYQGATGFNRLFKIKINAPGQFDRLVKSFNANIPKWIKKAQDQFNVKGFSMEKLVHSVRSCGEFDNEWQEIPRGVKNIMMAIAAGKITPAQAQQRMSEEIGKKMEKTLRKKIEKKLNKKFKKMITKQIVKIAAKVGAKAAGKSLAKKIPGVGAIVGFGYGISEICQGNYAQAGLEMGSGMASTVPGVGTALSCALDAAGASKEIIQACLEWNKLQAFVDRGFQ